MNEYIQQSIFNQNHNTMQIAEVNRESLDELRRCNVEEEDEQDGVSLRSDVDLNESDDSYLSYCSEQGIANNDELQLGLSHKTVNDGDCHLSKQMIEDFSTSEFQSQTERSAQKIEQNCLNSHEMTTFNQAHLTNYNTNESKNQQSNINCHDDTLDLSQMLEMLDELEKRERFIEQQQNNKQSVEKNRKQAEHEQKNHTVRETSSRQAPKISSKKVHQQQKPLIKSSDSKSYQPNHQLLSTQKQQHKIIHTTWPYYPWRNSNTLKKTARNQNRNEEFASENYLFWGVRISIKLSSFMSISKNVLVVPFSNAQFSDPVSKIVNNKIKYNLNEILLKQAAKCNEKQVPNGKVFSVKAKGLESNYRGIYFVKTPQQAISQGLKYYHINLLKKSITNIFSLLDTHNENHIVFPEFHWGSFTSRELCEILISSIFREINQSQRNYQCQYLREVVICVSNCESFELYLRYFRYFVKEMM